jgi:hypothetical protein
VIRALVHDGHEVLIGAGGRPLNLLKQEFPALTSIPFPGYDILYPEGKGMVLKMALQAPGILIKIAREHRKLKKIIREHSIDIVVSDNRFGLWNKKIRSVYITHQVMIKCPPSLGFLEPLLYRIHKHYINKYDVCLIPDAAGNKNLSGDLSHLFPLPGNASFTGPLSRFAGNIHTPAETQWDLLVILSGPEPQRTHFEQSLLGQLLKTTLKTLVVKGTPEQNETINFGSHIAVVPHLTAVEMEQAVFAAKLILSRPGYSTIMDLSACGKKAIFVPTPGQTEQEYLGDLMMRRGWCYCTEQKKFNLEKALEQSEKYSGIPLLDHPGVTELVRKIL